MVYPDTFEGFAVVSPKDWKNLKRIEVRLISIFREHSFIHRVPMLLCESNRLSYVRYALCSKLADTRPNSSNQNLSRTTILISKSLLVVSVVVTFILPLLTGTTRHSPWWLDMVFEAQGFVVIRILIYVLTEIVGHVLKVGSKVTGVKVGDRVGVGAQILSCLDCPQCKEDNETYCPQQLGRSRNPYPHTGLTLLEDTYGAYYPDGTLSHGGYSSHIRAHEHFVFPIPEKLETDLAAPMLCAGLTAYSPLVRSSSGPGKKVGILGMFVNGCSFSRYDEANLCE